MLNAYNQFKENIQSVRELDALYLHLYNSPLAPPPTTLALNYPLYLHLLQNPIPPTSISDILRAEIVYLISALDKLIHECVRLGMIDVFNSTRVQTAKFRAFDISVTTLTEIQKNGIPPPAWWFEMEVINQHKHLAFQDPDKINDALSLIWDEQYKWQKIAAPFGVPEKDLKTRLRTVVSRRNQIVHAADFDLLTNTKNPIDHVDVFPNIAFIEKLGDEIYNLIK